MPMLAFRLSAPSILVDIGGLPGLADIDINKSGVRLGALVRWRDIERDARLLTAHPLLRSAVEHVAHYQIRNRGTVGGSLAHADPSAELPGVAVACDATVLIAGAGGRRRSIPAAQLFNGVLTTDLAFDELIVALQLPAWPGSRRWAFQEFARRRGDFAVAGIVLHYDEDDEGRAVNPHVGGIGIADRPLRIGLAESALAGKVVEANVVSAMALAVSECVKLPDDLHASAAYRRSLAATLATRAMSAASRRAHA